MAINQAMCGSYKQESTAGIHYWAQHTRTSSTLAADTFYIAMFTSSRTDANEDLTGYTAKGLALTSVTLGKADNSSAVPTAFLDFADTTWASSSISNARCAVIYNYTLSSASTGATINHAAYPSVCVLDFGGNKSSSSGDFTIQYPANDANNAIIRLA